MLRGLMMDQPLLISSLIAHAARNHGDTEIVSRCADGAIHRYTYAEAERRARCLALGLQRRGVKFGDRIGTLAWNGHRHMEIYFGIAGMGAVVHTVNPRLAPDQIGYIVNHAKDGYVFFDLTFCGLVESLAPMCPSVKSWVALCGPEDLPAGRISNLLCYEELLDAEGSGYEWPRLDEGAASGLCYTSGTTGNPKGVLYSHRSSVLHAFAVSLPDALACSARDCVLPAVPMFHVNAWGIPHAAAMNGAKLVLPGPALDGLSLYELMEAERVTLSAGVPTVWLGLLAHMRENGLRFSTLERVVVGGSACPPAMIRAFRQLYGVRCQHAWGMTETSPLGTYCAFKAKHSAASEDEKVALLAKQGRAVFGIETRIVGEHGEELPRSGKISGALEVRGPWIASAYYGADGGDLLHDGWFPTGDVATIDPDGYVQITDRAKDVIKSGGEWISSIELENVAMAHPAIAEAAVIGAAHPKWGERPLLVVVRRSGVDVTREDLLGFYRDKVAKWWIPDDVLFVESLPHTATGKLLKNHLREKFRSHKPSAA